MLKDVPIEHMRSTIQVMSRMGANICRDGRNVKISMDKRPQPISFIRTASYPGFPTDLQSPLVAALCTADGKSCVQERMFENRFMIVEELKKMGADISLKDQTAHIFPVKKLLAKEVTVRELRGGAALVIAALGAEGRSIIKSSGIICRGYEDIAGDLAGLGAEIRVIS